MSRTSLVVPLSLAAGVVFALAGCDPGKSEVTKYASPQLVPGHIAKCPEHVKDWQIVVDSGTHGEHDWKLITVNSIPLSGDLGKAPEAHDCQRLVVPRGNELEFGPLAAIFAAESLFVTPPVNEDGLPTRAVATIYAFPSGYAPLKIAPGLNCLYVHQRGNRWLAHMVPVMGLGDCLLPLREMNASRELQVRPDPDASKAEEIPAVARWDGEFEGRGRNEHHIGVRCGDYWCEVGNPGFISAAARHPSMVPNRPLKASLPEPGTGERARVARNRGLFDEQRLAVRQDDGTLTVGPVVATLMPHPQLATLAAEGEFKSGWVEVASAYLPEDVQGYKAKMNLEQGVNSLSLRLATTAELAAEGVTITEACKATDAGPHWWVRVTSAVTASSAVYCGRRFDHMGKLTALPGAVRWQWLEHDEKTWFPCGGGCCTRE